MPLKENGRIGVHTLFPRTHRECNEALKGCQTNGAAAEIFVVQATYRGLWMSSATVERHMTNVTPGDDINDVFGDVGGVVGHAFEVFGDQDQLKSRENDRGIFHHVGEQFAKHLVAQRST